MTQFSSASEFVQYYHTRFSFPSDHALSVDFGNTVIKVHTTGEALAEKLRHYFREFLTDTDNADIEIYAADSDAPSFDLPFQDREPEPGKKKIKEEFFDFDSARIIRKKKTGMLFYISQEHNLAMGPALENDNQVINFVNNRFIERMSSRGSLIFHAAAVTLNNSGYAMAGFSGMGKSTLALHIMSRGIDFISNDRLLVREEDGAIIMRGVAKYPRINPGTILNNRDLESLLSDEEKAELNELPLEELWELEQKYDLFIDEVYGEDKFHLSGTMKGLIILNWNREEKDTSIQQIDITSRRDLFPAFMKTPGLFYAPGTPVTDQSEGAYEKVLKNIEVWEITGGIDFEKAADFFAEKMKV